MPIVGFHFNKISVEKKKPIEGNVQIKSNASITDLKEEKLPTGKTKADGLRFDFKFLIEYEPKLGELLLQGFIYYFDDAKILKDIVKSWKKDKTLPPDITMQIINAVLMKSTVKALSLAQEVNLPPHIPMPAIKQDINPKNYIG